MAEAPLVFAFDPDEDFDPFKQDGLWSFFSEQGESWRLSCARVVSRVCECWVVSGWVLIEWWVLSMREWWVLNVKCWVWVLSVKWWVLNVKCGRMLGVEYWVYESIDYWVCECWLLSVSVIECWVLSVYESWMWSRVWMCVSVACVNIEFWVCEFSPCFQC